jgi:hypothetical protein
VPRAYDRRQLVIDRNPLNQLATDIGNLPKLDPFNLEALWEALVDVIKQLTQIDLHTPATLVASIIDLIGEVGGNIAEAIDDLLRNLVASITLVVPPTGLVGTALHNLISAFTALLPNTIQAVWNGYDPLEPTYNDNPQTQFKPPNVFDVLDSIQKRLNDNEDAIAEFITSQSNANFSGNSAVEVFSRYSPGNSLGVAAADAGKWVQTYPSGTAAGFLGVNGGNAAWAKAQPVNGSCVARYAKTQTKTDIQRVGITVASVTQDISVFNIPFSGTAYNYIYGRMNAAGTQYVFARICRREAVIGYRNGGGEVTIGTVPNFTMRAGATYWLDIGFNNTTAAARRTYTLWENNKSLYTVAETGTGSALDTINAAGEATSNNNKFTGFGVYASFSNAVLLIPATLFPAPVSTFGMLDNIPAQVRGSGIQVTRTLTANSGVPSGSNPAYVPNSFFNRVDYRTDDLSFNATTSEVTVSAPGWYVVNFMAGGSNGNVALAGLWRLCLFKNGAAANSPTFEGPQGNWGLVGAAPGLQLVTTTYLNAGDRIRPGWVSTTAFNQQSSNTGKDTFFQMTFLGNQKPTTA